MPSSEFQTTENVDPRGDLLLKVPRLLTQTSHATSDDASHSGEQPAMVLIRVSSMIMTASSPVFKAMLEGGFRESQGPSDANTTQIISLPEDNYDGMLLVCKILHHHHESHTPVSAEHIVEVARLGDKYDCSRVLAFWFRAQLMSQTFTMTFWSTQQIAMTINAAYLFDDIEVFYSFTLVAISQMHWSPRNPAFWNHLNDAMRTRLEVIVSNISVERHAALQSMYQELLSELFNDAHSFPDNDLPCITAYDGDTHHHPQVCGNQAKRAAAFISSLNIVGLWGGIHRKAIEYSLEYALDTVEHISKTRALGVISECDPPSSCDSCSLFWDGVIQESVHKFRNDLYGVCLKCLKEDIFSQQEPDFLQKCSKHTADILPGILKIQVLATGWWKFVQE